MEQESIIHVNTDPTAIMPADNARVTNHLASLPSRTDVAIVGGGVAGLISAIALARQGLQVVVAEKKSYPRDKVCGACLNANALDTLAKLSLLHLLDELQAPTLTQVQIQCGSRTVRLPLPHGRAITRREFDLALANEARRCGVTIAENTTASLEELRHDQNLRCVKIQGSQQVHHMEAAIVLVAAGLSGVREGSQPWPAQVTPRSKIGIGLSLTCQTHNIAPNTIHLCVRENGYLGLVQAEQGVLNLAAAVDSDLLKQSKSFGIWVHETLAKYQLHIDYPFEEAEWRGTPTLTRKVLRPYGQRWLAIGDSAGYVEPFTGEGMAWAMAGGNLAAHVVSSHLKHWSTKHEEEWGTIYRKMIRHRQLSCRTLSWLLQNSFRSRLAIEAAAWFPGIGSWLIHGINQQAQPATMDVAPSKA